jgi:hypothetical protein
MRAPLPEQPPASEPMSRERMLVVRRCLWVLGFLGGGSALGVAFSLWLVNHAPLLLVALSPLGRHVVLAAPLTHPAVLLLVVVARRLIFYGALFHLGRALGPAGIDWLEARSAVAARFVRWLEGWFARASHLVLLVLAGPTTSALAGISGMRFGVFLPLVATGLAVRMALLIGFAEWLRAPIEQLLALIDEYWIPGTVVLASGVAFFQWRRLRSARAEVDSLTRL